MLFHSTHNAPAAIAAVGTAAALAAACRSYFGCCPKTYSPYKKTFTDITPVGMCVWTVVPDATVKTAVHGGVKMGTVTAKW
jgi:hypothetical protein